MQRVVTLRGGSPWGFRLVGGSDFRANLAISKITPGGKADLAGLKPGDVILSINSDDTTKLSHLEAQNRVKSSTNMLILTVESGGTGQRPASSSQAASSPPASTNTAGPPKPSSFTSSVAPTPKTWQPSKPKPVSAPAPATHVSNDDFLPPPPPSDMLQQQSHSKPAQEDFPAPPPLTIPVTKQEPSSNQELTCEGCKQKIKGPYLTAQGKNWHPEEFVCASANCRRTLQNCGFIEENGQRYCSDCYEKYFAHACGKCHQKIVGQVMHALNQTWHVECFVCSECNKPFQDGVFQMENDKPYCVADYKKKFGSVCKGCNRPIEGGDHYVEAIKAQWHDKCFTCSVCHCDLKNVGFFAVNERPVCSNHKNARLPA